MKSPQSLLILLAALWSHAHAQLTSQQLDALELTGVLLDSSATTPWTVITDAAALGEDALLSPNIADGQSTSISITITGPTDINFRWRVSSEDFGDELTYAVDGTTITSISGEVDWTVYFTSVPAGQHTLTWTYSKDEQISGGSDSAQVDGIVFSALTPPNSASGPLPNAYLDHSYYFAPDTLTAGSSFAVTSGALPPGITLHPTRGELSGRPTTPGTYNFGITASNGATTGSESARTIIVSSATATAAQPTATTRSFHWEGNSPWSDQPDPDAAGTTILRSGSIGDNATSTIGFPVWGPSVMTFDWRCDCEGEADFLNLLFDGNKIGSITGLFPWRSETLNLPPGQHHIEFEYNKDASSSVGEDFGAIRNFRVTGYTEWLTTQAALAHIGPLADGDGDGSETLWEYATGTSATVANVATSPTLDAANAFLALPQTLPGDLEMKAQSGTDLLNWTDRTLSPNIGASSFQLSLNGAPADRSFYRFVLGFRGAN